MRLKLLSPEHSAALRDAQTWLDNPFARREARRDRTRKQPTKSFAWMALVLAPLAILMAVGAGYLQSAHIGVPRVLGGDYGTVYFYVIAGIHVWFVIGASRKHTLLMLAREYHQNTLSSVLLLPMTPFQILLESGLYPWLAAMRAALVLLPVYAMLTALGAVSWLDLLMLYVVFALCSVTFPAWRRPVLSETGPVGMPVQTMATQNRSTQQAMLQASGGSGTGGWIVIAIYLPIAIGAKAMLVRGGISSMYIDLKPYVPVGVIDIMMASMVSWPLLLARLLVAPLDWFGWRLPPLPLVLLFAMVSRYTAVVRTAELLSVGYFRDLATLSTYKGRIKLEGATRFAGVLMVTGYLWKWGVRNGGLGLVTAAGHTPGQTGMIGFMVLVLLITLWRAMRRAGMLAAWGAASQRRGAMTAMRITARGALRFILEPFAGGASVYLFACLAAQTNPLVAGAGRMAGHILAIGLSGMALSACVGALWGIAGTFVGVLVVIGWFALFGTYAIKGAFPLIYLSPSFGMLHAAETPMLTGAIVLLPGAVWWQWVRYCAGAALVLAAPALSAIIRARHISIGDDVSALDPTLVGTAPFGDAAISEKRAAESADTRLGVLIVNAIQRRMDNPVAIKEMRVKFRGKFEARAVRTIVGFGLLSSIALIFAAPFVPEALGSGPAITLYGPALTGHMLTAASLTCCLYYIVLLLPFLFGFATYQAFYTEREKSTLGFVLLTPLPGRSIVTGKLIGMLSMGITFTVFMAVWTLVLSLVLLPVAGPVAIVLWLLIITTSAASTVMFASCTLAVLSHFPKLSPQYLGCFTVLASQIVIQGAIYTAKYSAAVSAAVAERLGYASIYVTWVVVLLGEALVIWIAIQIATWGVKRMRAGDLAFATSAQQN